MHRDFSEYALIDFINNYTQGLLERTLRSDNSHHKTQKSSDKDNRSNINPNLKIRIPELRTETFLDTILDPSKVNHLMQDCCLLNNNVE